MKLSHHFWHSVVVPSYCMTMLIRILTLQQVYMYFRGSGKAAEMKREAARGTMMAAL